MKIFVYGTLIDMAALGRCAGRPVKSHPEHAVLHGFTRVVLRGARYPTLRRAPGKHVAGVIVRINADMLVRLTNYEFGALPAGAYAAAWPNRPAPGARVHRRRRDEPGLGAG